MGHCWPFETETRNSWHSSVIQEQIAHFNGSIYPRPIMMNLYLLSVFHIHSLRHFVGVYQLMSGSLSYCCIQ
jgi:hypothetical protein